MKIYKVIPGEYQEVINVWEDSVRASHHFLTEEDILFYKSEISKHSFTGIDLFCVKDSAGKIIAFIGISEDKIEMLFIHSSERGKKIGSQLVDFAINNYNVKKVDVNEQNELAVNFYKAQGFKIIARKELDDSGKNFPILNMSL